MTALQEQGRLAKAASYTLATAGTARKNAALEAIADILTERRGEWLSANAQDVAAAREAGMRPAMLDRLTLTEERVSGIVEAVRQVAALPDPIGKVDKMETRPNGLIIGRRRVPLGVAAIIFEARPNVTVDAAALCLKSGNVCILRGGKEAIRSNRKAAELMRLALERAGLPPTATLADIEREYERSLRQRAGLLETFETMNHRAGELASILSQAEAAGDLDRCKIAAQQASTRLDEAKTDFARLLLAKHMLEAAIATWESKRQAEAYAPASRLLSLMTDGRWTEVSLTAEGTLQVTDAVKTVRSPVHLSLGTCQQLYLALRIALLASADQVGRAIPILADDILVNFDERRRVGAARALVELAQTRQIILFTCHEEVVRTLKKAAKQVGQAATVINL